MFPAVAEQLLQEGWTGSPQRHGQVSTSSSCTCLPWLYRHGTLASFYQVSHVFQSHFSTFGTLFAPLSASVEGSAGKSPLLCCWDLAWVGFFQKLQNKQQHSCLPRKAFEVSS